MSKKDNVRCAWCSKKGATVPVGNTGQKVHPECEGQMTGVVKKLDPPRRFPKAG